MATWDKRSVMQWFDAHGGAWVVVRERGGILRVQGRNRGVDELNACSADLQEVELQCGLSQVQVHLTLHDQAVLVHLLARPEPSTEDEARLALAVSIPYTHLVLEEIPAPADALPYEPRRPAPERAG
ncbi:MAG TPA: hypothetical protein VL359_19940 [bacterium]|nr:hypothetical protein [bacterium]